jgi:hypothetical protein
MSETETSKCDKIRRLHAHWIKHELVCTCGSRRFLERVSKIPPERDPEAGQIEERIVNGK